MWPPPVDNATSAAGPFASALEIRSRKHLEDASSGTALLLAIYDAGDCEATLNALEVPPDLSDLSGVLLAKTRLTDADGRRTRVAKKFKAEAAGCPTLVFVKAGADLWEDFQVRRPGPTPSRAARADEL